MHSIFTITLGCLLSLFAYESAYTLTSQEQSSKLSASEEALVRSSRTAVISTGFSGPYFDAHFKLERVVNKSADRRVIWKFSVGDYKAILSDDVGFYTDEKGTRLNSHGVLNALSTAHDIKSTIPRKRADKLMSQCLGKYIEGPVVLQSFGTDRKARLLFTASSIPRFLKKGKDLNKPVIYTGFLDLETGKCTKGIAQAGRPRANGE